MRLYQPATSGFGSFNMERFNVIPCSCAKTRVFLTTIIKGLEVDTDMAIPILIRYNESWSSNGMP